MRSLANLSFGFLIGMAAITAEAQAPDDFAVLPVDTFICNFAGTSDMGDLQDAFDEFNAWADAETISDLTIYLLTPSFYSEDITYDIVGFNIWGSGASFGSGNTAMSGDPDSLAPFEGVVECSSHSLYALVGVKPPVQDPQSGSLWEVSNCTMKGNRSTDEGVAAVAAASQLFAQWNLNDAHAALFNISGLPSDTSYDFKWLTYYPSYDTFGSLFDNLVNSGSVQTLGAMLDPVMDCDSSRMYNMTLMREATTE